VPATLLPETEFGNKANDEAALLRGTHAAVWESPEGRRAKIWLQR